MEYYTDASQDEHNRQYGNVMPLFLSVPGGPAPAQIRELVANNPRESSLGFAVLALPANNPAHQGLIYALHSVSRFAPILGHPPTQWDNHLFGSINEVIGNQIPPTVEFPTDAFNRLNGGALYRVGLPQRMDAMFAADPNLQLLGEFINLDAGTELIQSRNVVPIPHRYMRHFIAGPLSPRQAWEIVAHDIIHHNDQVVCEPLINFLRLACTRNAAQDTASILARLPLDVPLADAALVNHRQELIAHKLPGLNRTPTLAAGLQVAQGLGELVAEQRATRQDNADRYAASRRKTVDEYFGASVGTLLRLCQVASSNDLPPIYQALADFGRKKERLTMQRAVEEAMAQMGLSQLTFVVTADLATKISSLMWKAHDEDLSQGIHPFCVGETNPDAVADLQELTRRYDLISEGNAAPSLSDAQSLVGISKVTLPLSLIQLDCQNKLFVIFCRVFLGAAHPVTIAWEAHAETTSQRLMQLQHYKPRTAGHQYLFAALFQRWCQLRFSHWVSVQWVQPNAAATPIWDDIWTYLALKTGWESPLPERYLQATPSPSLAPTDSSSRSTISGITEGSTVRTPPADSSRAGGSSNDASNSDQLGTAVTPDVYNTVYEPFKSTGIRARDGIRKAREAGHNVPKNDSKETICVSFHVKGICNTNCGRKSDHRPQSDAEIARTLAWCNHAFVN